MRRRQALAFVVQSCSSLFAAMAAKAAASTARRRAATGAGGREVTTPPGSPNGDRRADMEKFLQDVVSWQGGGQEGRKGEQVPETRRGDRDGGGSRDANDSRGSDGAILAAIADLSQQMRGLETRFTRQVGDLEVRVAELNL